MAPAHALFDASLDSNLLATIFEPSSSAANVEQSLQQVVNEYTIASPSLSLVVFTRTLRVVLSSWRLLPSAGEESEPGFPVDKFDYGYTALHAIKPKNNQPDTLEYKVVRCLTDEFKKHDELTVKVLRGIIDAASKKYLVLMLSIAAAENGVAVDTSLDPVPSTATYQAVLSLPPGTMSNSTIDIGSKSTGNRSSQPARKSPKKGQNTFAPAPLPINNDPQRLSTLSVSSITHKTPDKPEKRRADPAKNCFYVSTKWYDGEHYWVQQQLRQDPDLEWTTLRDRINERFGAMEFYDEKKGMIVKRTERTTAGVQCRFQEFRRNMRIRRNQGLATQGTESDVEPEEESKVPIDRFMSRNIGKRKRVEVSA